MDKYVYSPNYTYFWTYRVKDFQPFLKSETCKRIINDKLLSIIPEYAQDRCYYAVLDNHLHLVLHVEDVKRLERHLQTVFGGGAFEINKFLRRRGRLWGRPFVLSPKDEDGFNRIVAYVLGNPIRHGIVKSLDELYNYPHSRFRYFADRFGREFADNVILNGLKMKVSEDDEEKFWSQYATKASPQLKLGERIHDEGVPAAEAGERIHDEGVPAAEAGGKDT